MEPLNINKIKLPDPQPQLPGPPSVGLNNTKFKPPTVDNPNIKLPSDQVKALDPSNALSSGGGGSSLLSAATTAASLTPTGIAANAALGAVSGGGSGINACGDITNRINGLNTNIDSLNPKGLISDGLGPSWSPDKFSPADLLKPPAIPNIPIPSDCPAINKAQENLNNLKNSYPQPKIPQPPSLPRVRTVTI